MDMRRIELASVPAPERDCPGAPVALTDATICERVEKVLAGMRARGLDQLIVYCDVEHSGNFNYLTGFFTRFEESLLVVNADGTMHVVLGNENLNKASKARVAIEPEHVVHAPLFSLPNQPDTADRPLRDLLREAGVCPGSRVGVAGWKLFTSPHEDNDTRLDVPAFIVDDLRAIVGEQGVVVHAGGVFVGPEGARTTNNANELAHYEFGASLASDCVLDAMDAVAPGVTEMELGDKLVRYGQHTSVVTIAAAGPRFVKANMFPTATSVQAGDPIALTVGYSGGLSSRAAYAVEDAGQLPQGCEDYLERVAKPYFNAYAHWLETIHVGLRGGELFSEIERVLPRAEYGWSLCPGHLTAEEEWLCSPIYEGSSEVLRSGMLLQIDIIPSVAGYGGVSAESTVALADAELRAELSERYPGLWERVCSRRAYLHDVLGIDVHEDVLPMCGTVAYLRPYLLAKDKALVVCR